MLKGENIIYFSSDDWSNGLKTSQYHMAVRLARDNRVLYVNSIGMRAPTVSKKDVTRIAAKFRRWLRGARKVHDNLYIVTPLVIPFHRSRLARFFNRLLLVAYVRVLQRKLALHRPIIWTFLPNVVNVFGSLGEKKWVYYCADQMASFRGAPPSIAAMERELVRRSDLVFATSRCLYEEKKRLNVNTFYAPHGVDVALFSSALAVSTRVPADIRALPKPVIGFFGLVCSEWVDLDLLVRAARQHPEWSIVLLGTVSDDVPDVSGVRNIVFLGPKKYEELPGYCKAFDVAVIPFKMTELVRNVNPLKLKEYLAAGLPVVTTRMPEVEQYRDMVRIADEPGEFIRHVEAALAADSPAERRRRSDSVLKDSWDARFADVAHIIARTDARTDARTNARSMTGAGPRSGTAGEAA